MDIQFSFRNTNPATPDQVCWSGFLVGLSETFITIPWLPWGERGNLEEERNLGFLLKEWYSCSHFESFPEKVSVSQLCLTLCDPAGCSPPGSPRPWSFAGKNTGVGCHFLLQVIFPTQGSNPSLAHCRQMLHHLSYQGSPHYLMKIHQIKFACLPLCSNCISQSYKW